MVPACRVHRDDLRGGRQALPRARWRTLLREDGSAYFTADLGKLPGDSFVQFGTNGKLLVASFHYTPAGLSAYYAVVYIDRTPAASFDLAPLSWVTLARWTGPTTTVGNTEGVFEIFGVRAAALGGRNIPVLADWPGGTVSAVEAAYFEANIPFRAMVAGYLPGPLLKVKAPGDCVNFRTKPSTDSPVKGVRRRRSPRAGVGDTQRVDSRTWRLVALGGSEASWVAAEFLE